MRPMSKGMCILLVRETIAIRLEAIAKRLKAIASRLEAIAIRLEAIAKRLECPMGCVFLVGRSPGPLGRVVYFPSFSGCLPGRSSYLNTQSSTVCRVPVSSC